MTTNLDDRIRVLMSRLDDATPLAPTFESLDSWVTVQKSEPERGRRWAPIMAVAAACALLGGLVAVNELRKTIPQSLSTSSTKQVATDLPTGWSVESAVGPGSSTERGLEPMVTTYATDQAPLGPILALFSAQLGPGGPSQGSRSVTLPDGRRAAVALDKWGGRTADIETSSGKWIKMRSRGFDEAALLRLAATVVVDASGLPSLPSTTAADAGLASTATGTGWVPTDFGTQLDVTSIPDGETVTHYRAPDSAGTVTIYAYVPTAYNRAMIALAGGPTVAADGLIDFAYHLPPTLAGVYTERNGLAFYAEGPSTATAEMHHLVKSLHPVSDGEWGRLVAASPPGPTVQTPSTIRPPTPVTSIQLP